MCGAITSCFSVSEKTQPSGLYGEGLVVLRKLCKILELVAQLALRVFYDRRGSIFRCCTLQKKKPHPKPRGIHKPIYFLQVRSSISQSIARVVGEDWWLRAYNGFENNTSSSTGKHMLQVEAKSFHSRLLPHTHRRPASDGYNSLPARFLSAVAFLKGKPLVRLSAPVLREMRPLVVPNSSTQPPTAANSA